MFHVFKQKISKLFWEIDLPDLRDVQNSHLDLGGGSNPRNPFNANIFFTCDFIAPIKQVEGVTFVQCDLTEKLPFKTNSFSSISAYDVLEHIPRWQKEKNKVTFPFINLMSEIFRVLKPGGYFYAITPMYPSRAAFVDPTHVNTLTLESVDYFAGPTHAKALGYGFEGKFEIIFSGWLRGSGPFNTGKSIRSQLRMYQWTSRFLILILKIFKRLVLVRANFRPSHGLWVLKKPI